MRKNNRGRASEIIFAVILLASIGLTVFSFVQTRWQATLEGWSNLNGTFGESLFEFNITALAFIGLSCIVSIFALITAVIIFANGKVKGSFLKILFSCVCVEKLIYCVLFVYKMNSYWASSLVGSNMIIWVLMIFVTILQLIVAILLLLLACDKKIFAPVTLFFSIVLALTMCAEIVNTHIYTFFEIPLLPEVAIWQNAEILNEGIANMACYWILCFALLGIFLSISKVRTSIKFGTFMPQAESEEERFFKDSVVVPKTIISKEENNNEKDDEEIEPIEENAIVEKQDDSVVEKIDDVDVKEWTEGIPELVPEIDTDEKFKVDVDLVAELKELFGEEETMDENSVGADEDSDNKFSEELIGIEESIEQREELQKVATQTVAADLINLTMHWQKGEISESEYNQLKKELLDKHYSVMNMLGSAERKDD